MTVRDMRNIGKLGLVADMLARDALKAYKKFHEGINANSASPVYMLEWAGELYSHAAEWRLYCDLTEVCIGRLKHLTEKGERHPGWDDVTIAELQEYVKERGRYMRAVPNSTSASYNLMAAHLCEKYTEFIMRGCVRWSNDWFYRAQLKDPEWIAWDAERTAEVQAERAAKEAAAALAEKKAEEARARVRAAVIKNVVPNPNDVLLGWPRLEDARLIRSSELMLAIRTAHTLAAQLKGREVDI